MLGGASATWYITGFAAFQLLHIVSYPVAFAFMVLVTVFTFSAAIRQDEAVLGMLGAIGGLGTPFFLYGEQGSLPALVGYDCLVVLGTNAIYLSKGWRSLLWTSAIGGWSVLVLAFGNLTPTHRWALQAGVLVVWLVLWSATTLRSLLEAKDPMRWPLPASRLREVFSPQDIAGTPYGDIALLTLLTPLVALFFSRGIWDTGDTLWGLSALVTALLYASVWERIRHLSRLPILASAHAVSAAVLMAIAVALLFGGHIQILSWTALSIALLFLGRRLGEVALGTCGHILSAIVGLWLLHRLAEGAHSDIAIVTARGLSDAVVVLGLLAVSRLAQERFVRVFELVAYVGVLGWTWRELSVLPAGEAIVTVAYGAYGLALLAASMKTRKLGLATLLVAVAKLFLVDLDRVDPFLRILLFLGFGGLFLGIGYYYRDRWYDADGEKPNPAL
jgi:uncharacterized membrane protein